MRFENKVVFITGAGGYIGGTTARMFAREGASVAVCDINENAVQKTVDDIVAAGGKAIGIITNVTDSKSVDAAVQKTVDTFGRLDVMVHAAGGSAREDAKVLVDQCDEVILRVLGINLLGGIYASRAAARVMIAQGEGGRIINIASTVGVNGLKGYVDYAAAKGGLLSMTRSLAKELSPYHITVNTVTPGVVQRPDSNTEAIKTNFLEQKCTAEDVGSLILFVASEEARFVTGQTHIIDGGRTLAMKGTDI